MYDLDYIARQSGRFFHGVDHKPLDHERLQAHTDRFKQIHAVGRDIVKTQRALKGRVRGPLGSTDLTFSHAEEPQKSPTKPIGSTDLPFSGATAQVSSPKATGEAPKVSFSHPAVATPTVKPTDLPTLPTFSHGTPETPAPAPAGPAPSVSFSDPGEFAQGINAVRRPAPPVAFSSIPRDLTAARDKTPLTDSQKRSLAVSESWTPETGWVRSD